MALLQRPLTLQELEAIADAARVALDCYNAAPAESHAKIPAPVHAAMHKLKLAMEGKP